jgi:hypothetical protein
MQPYHHQQTFDTIVELWCNVRLDHAGSHGRPVATLAARQTCLTTNSSGLFSAVTGLFWTVAGLYTRKTSAEPHVG